MILGIGVDIFAIGRLSEQAIAKEDAFLRRAYTQAERVQAQMRSERHRFLAGRFCAKEAIYKALCVCVEEFHPGDIQIVDDVDGRPHVALLGHTKDAFEAWHTKAYRIEVSLSYETELVCAFALIEDI